ncbi:MAG: helix-turn-helix transcriptional regulator [Pseudomonadota bacterium]
MNIDEKEALAFTGDIGVVASAVRLKAARLAAGFKVQKQFAEACGESATNYNNMEKGNVLPNRTVMQFLYRGYRIDFNFLVNGLFSQLPQDVQERLFEHLATVKSEWDRKPS